MPCRAIGVDSELVGEIDTAVGLNCTDPSSNSEITAISGRVIALPNKQDPPVREHYDLGIKLTVRAIGIDGKLFGEQNAAVVFDCADPS